MDGVSAITNKDDRNKAEQETDATLVSERPCRSSVIMNTDEHCKADEVTFAVPELPAWQIRREVNKLRRKHRPVSITPELTYQKYEMPGTSKDQQISTPVESQFKVPGTSKDQPYLPVDTKSQFVPGTSKDQPYLPVLTKFKFGLPGTSIDQPYLPVLTKFKYGVPGTSRDQPYFPVVRKYQFARRAQGRKFPRGVPTARRSRRHVHKPDRITYENSDDDGDDEKDN